MNDNVLVHHGIKGQRWGVRRFQNADGTRTAAGRKRYYTGESLVSKQKNAPSGAKSDNYGGKGVPKGALSLIPNNASKERTGLTDEQKETLKKVGKAALIAGGVAAAGYLYTQNAPAINEAVGKLASTAVSELSRTKQVTQALGKEYMKKTASEAYANVVKPAASKVLKASAQGVAIMATKKMLETVVGKENVDDTIQAYNAYNKKNKIGRTPEFGSKNNLEDDDDD